MLLLLMLNSLAIAGPASVQSLAAIGQAVEQFVAAKIESPDSIRTEISVGKLDRRLRLKSCDSELSLKVHNRSRTGGRMSVNVSCQSNTRWSIYVPVTVKQFGSVMIASRSVGRGGRITAADLIREERRLDTITAGYFTQKANLTGMTARRNIRSGMVIAPVHVRPPYAVKKGENVIIKAAIGGVEVRMDGTALDNGAEGEVIDVSNSSSNKTVEALVIRPGVVQVRL